MLIFPCHKYWMPDLKKLEMLIYTQKFCDTGYEISSNYPLFSTSSLIEKNTKVCTPQLNWVN